jgi:hypothetical protein
MISASVKRIDLSGALAKGPKVATRVRRMVTLAVREDTKPYVPYVTGALRQSAETASNPDKGLLVYDTPYARAQYYGLPHKTWPGTGMQWFELSLAVNRAKWEAIAQIEAERAL